MALHTGQTAETIEKDVDRDRYMSADEAKAYGLIDKPKAADSSKFRSSRPPR